MPQASDRQPAGIPTAAPPPLPKTQKGAYGFGGFISGFALNAPNYLANPIYNLALGLNPVLIGVPQFRRARLDVDRLDLSADEQDGQGRSRSHSILWRRAQ